MHNFESLNKQQSMLEIFEETTSSIEDNFTGGILNGTQEAVPSQCFVFKFEGVTPWDNPDNLVSAETENLVHYLTDIVILPVLFLIGATANVINMAVFYKQGLKERINVCLFSLSLADLLHLIFRMLLSVEQITLQLTTKEEYGSIMRFITNNNLFGFYAITFVSEVLSAIIASERCFCILQPLRSQTVMSASTTTTIIVVVSVVVVGMYFFVTPRYRLVCAYDPNETSNMWVFIATEFYLNNQKAIDFFDVFVYGVGIPLVSIVVVVVTTTVTLIKLRQAAAWRASTSTSSSVSAREVALTMMLVYNSIFFVICVFPLVVFRVMILSVPEMNAGRGQHNLFFTFVWLADIMNYINATFNIIIYYSMGSRYRQTFWQLMGRRQKTDCRQ